MSNKQDFQNNRVVVLAGGVGGAKLASGIAAVMPPEKLTIVGNTGDDFQHMGLTICPDLDTLMYNLAGVNNPELGWGRLDESWRVMESVKAFGGPDWFNLGDLDLGVHLTRMHMLNAGLSLTAVTQHLCQKLGIQPTVLPMSDQPAPTMIETETAVLPFQEWFVKERWQPVVKNIQLPENSKSTRDVALALQKADLVIIAPSNPFVSIDPIFNCYPIRENVMDLPRAVVAVSPIVGGDAVKGPAAKLMREKGMDISPITVADYYGELLDGFVYDVQDQVIKGEFPVEALCVDTMMVDEASRKRVALDVLNFAVHLTQ
ncbi:MAG: 2-phospho-L-lactate transferase [Chloroflexota bacterium]